jgi:hypothetical protein
LRSGRPTTFSAVTAVRDADDDRSLRAGRVEHGDGALCRDHEPADQLVAWGCARPSGEKLLRNLIHVVPRRAKTTRQAPPEIGDHAPRIDYVKTLAAGRLDEGIEVGLVVR